MPESTSKTTAAKTTAAEPEPEPQPAVALAPASESSSADVHVLLAELQTAILNADEDAQKAIREQIAALGYSA